MEDQPQVKRLKHGINIRSLEHAISVTLQSKLADHLLKDFAWGFQSAPQVQHSAELAQLDLEAAGVPRTTFPNLEELAKAGSHGRHVNNIHRDIMSTASKQCTLTAFSTKLPFKGGALATTEILLPHEQFADLYHNHPASFAKRMVPDANALPTFWEAIKGHPLMAALHIADTSKAIPLGLHGDEVPITGLGKIWCRLALTFQFYSLVAAATGLSTVQLMFWVWAVFEKMCMDGEEGTVETFLKILTWSFQALFHGKWPTCDWKGNKQLHMVSLYLCMIFT